MDELQVERDAENIFLAYKRDEMFPEFLETYSRDVSEQILTAVKQRDFEAIGGLLYKELELFLSDLAEYEARRIQGWP